MPKYTKQHFETVARVLRTNLDQHEIDFSANKNDDDDVDEIYATASARVAIKGIALDFHNIFRTDNPRYDAEKFMEACGIDDWQDITQVEPWDLHLYKNRKGVDA
tara:strand:+ start:51 stop:365 length:315 start_codon:yes stop_codon:yes gene_type:complete